MNVRLREVTANDMDLLYQWANDPVVRMNAFHTEPISYDTHQKWFAKTLADKDVLLYIMCCKEEEQFKSAESAHRTDIGQIRLTIEDGQALIDYSIDASMRGQGLGSKLICMAEELLRSRRTDVIYCKAQVKYENDASMRVFEKCGYTANKQQDYIEYTKQLHIGRQKGMDRI